MDLYFDAPADSGKPALLLLHGFMASRAAWRDNLPALSAHVRPVPVEMPGHGRSPAPDDPRQYTLPALVTALERVRKAVGVETWHVCAHSFGAGIGIRYALDRPERVRSLTILNANAASRPSPDAEGRMAIAARADRIAAGGLEELARQRFHPRHAKRFPAAVKAELVADAERMSPLGASNLVRMATPDISVRDTFGQLRMPVLLVNGRWEKGFQPHRDWMAATLPGLRVIDLEGGHAINVEQPDAFNAAVIAFIGDVEDGRAAA